MNWAISSASIRCFLLWVNQLWRMMRKAVLGEKIVQALSNTIKMHNNFRMTWWWINFHHQAAERILGITEFQSLPFRKLFDLDSNSKMVPWFCSDLAWTTVQKRIKSGNPRKNFNAVLLRARTFVNRIGLHVLWNTYRIRKGLVFNFW